MGHGLDRLSTTTRLLAQGTQLFERGASRLRDLASRDIRLEQRLPDDPEIDDNRTTPAARIRSRTNAYSRPLVSSAPTRTTVRLSALMARP